MIKRANNNTPYRRDYMDRESQSAVRGFTNVCKFYFTLTVFGAGAWAAIKTIRAIGEWWQR